MGETLEGLVVTLSLSMASYRPHRVLLKELISTGNLDLQYWSAVVTPEIKGCFVVLFKNSEGLTWPFYNSFDILTYYTNCKVISKL